MVRYALHREALGALAADRPLVRSCILSKAHSLNSSKAHYSRYSRFSADPESAARQMAACMEYLHDPTQPPAEPKPAPAKVAIYCRSNRDADGSMDRQRARCLAFVKSNFPEAETEIFEDVGQPASELIRLRIALFHEKFDAVLVEDMDRLGRNFNRSQLIMARLMITGKRLYTVFHGPNEVRLAREVLWASVALLERDHRVATMGRDWWAEFEENSLTAK